MKKEKITYPVTQKVEVTDDYFGTQVSDPYRWLENDTSAETEAWVKAQNELTFGYLEAIPFRDKIKERFTELWNYPKYGVPSKKGDRYFYFKNDGLQNQAVFYVQEGLEGEPRVLLDPNKLSEDGTIALANWEISKDGKYLAYATAEAGSDWNKIFVMEIDNGENLDDELHWVKFSGISWRGDGFYYSRYDTPVEGLEYSSKNEYHKVYYHQLGTAQEEDELIYKNDDQPLRNYYAGTSEDENWLFLFETESTHGNALYFKDLRENNSEFTLLAEGFDYHYTPIDNLGDAFLIKTDDGAPKGKVVLVKASKPDKKSWKNLIPEKEEVLEDVMIAGDKIIAEYMKDAASVAYLYDFKGTYIEELALPGIGTLAGFSAKKDDMEAFYLFTSFTFPTTIYKYDVASNTSEVYKEAEIDFDASEYITEQVFYESKDGTKVPMFITHHKDMKKNGKNPVLLYGYGGFSVNLTPAFRISMLLLLENGGIYAMPNIRGGGEYGEEWHEAGTKMKKQNVFDDFIAAAEYLIGEGYTNPDKLAISGASNGGLLVGACMLQRPDLFKVALPAVGVLDMLRYHKFTIGWAWASDYGTSEDSEEMFKYLYGYSPLHNIKPGVEYPATLITTADHDDRVVPAHSFKFAATLQEYQTGYNPVLIRIEERAGHGAGKPTSKIIEEVADEVAFTFYNLGINVK